MFDTLHDLLHHTPFKPFRVRLANGKSYVVERPNWAILTDSTIVIAWPKRDRFVICDLPEIETIQPVHKKPSKK